MRGYDSDAAQNKRKAYGEVRIRVPALRKRAAVIDDIKDKRQRYRNDRIPHILREHREVFIILHGGLKREYDGRKYAHKVIAEYEHEFAQQKIYAQAQKGRVKHDAEEGEREHCGQIIPAVKYPGCYVLCLAECGFQ